MDAKITLSFNKDVIERAKQYAERNNMSLSRLVELLLDNITTQKYRSFEEFPVSDWVMQVAEGPVEYVTTPKKRNTLKNEYRNRKKK